MTYIEFIQYIKTWLGDTGDLAYIKEILEDEIELPINESGINQFPAAFVTPLPFTIDGNNRATYSCRIYLAGDVGLSPIIKPGLQTSSQRFLTYTSLIDIFHKFVQGIPDEFNGMLYPITCNPVLLWDSNVDGIYFDINFMSGVDCLI